MACTCGPILLIRFINSFSRFLLAQLYINSLTDKFTERKINTALDNMKKGEEGLDKAYDDTVNRIENQGHGIHELAKKVLFWVVYAKRPLITEELRHALAVEPGTSSLDMRSLYTLKDKYSCWNPCHFMDSLTGANDWFLLAVGAI